MNKLHKKRSLMHGFLFCCSVCLTAVFVVLFLIGTVKAALLGGGKNA